ncbi:MAG: PASTA domain-containing protein [Clostridiales bacterium]|nr:PASTA domain-containing protein [Clostridiales bacterium]
MAFPSQHSKMNVRAIIFVVVIILFFCALIGRLFVLQVIKFDYYQSIVIDQLTRETNTTPNRGKIYDTNMNLLATNTTVYRVFISPYDIAGGKEAFADIDDDAIEAVMAMKAEEMPQNEYAILIANKCAELLGVDYDTVMEKAQKVRRRDETIKKNVDPETAAELMKFVQDNGLTNMLNFSAELKRYYCYNELASHVLGFTNSDGNGVYGVEATYNDYLKGVSGKYITARDALGHDMPFKYESYVGAENGTNLVITIDLRIQYELENQLKAAYESAAAGNRVCGLVMDPNTGAILAMAVYPNYDCNNPYTLAEEFMIELESCEYAPESDEYAQLKSSLIYQMWNNKCVSETYEPGSTFKIITASVALEEDAVKVDDTFYCSGHYRGEGYSQAIACHKLAGHGRVTFARGLQQSCNPTLMQTAERIGLETFYKYFEAFGYTSRTGIDLPAEVFGIYHQQSAMHATELAVYSFGQTFKITPLQQLTAICSVANGGYIVTPHVMKEMIDDDGNVISSYELDNKRQILSEETCTTLTQILAEGVATDGGAKNAYVKGYSVAAKTGTSQKQDKYDENGERPYRIGSCVAFAPAEDPQIAVLIMVDEPTSGVSYGGTVAAPFVAKFLAAALPYLGIEPQYTESELANMEINIGNLVGMDIEDAGLYLTNRKLTFQKKGNGNVVTAQIPEAGSRLSVDNGVVYLYTEGELPSDTVTVPDLMGKNANACNRLIVNSKLNIRIDGSLNYSEGDTAQVISQSPAAGTQVSPGTVITVEFRHMDGTD